MKKWSVRLVFLLAVASVMAKDIQLLNVSYDPARELYEQYNKAFNAHWKQQTDDSVVIRQSRGGSGEQATSVVNDIEADVTILVLACDVNTIAERGRINKEWIRCLPDNSTPYTSTTVFLVCKGDPKQIRDWNGLVRPGASVATPSPKSSGGARWNQLATQGYALHHSNNDQAKAQDFVRALYKNVEILGSGARGSTSTFVERRIGDVLTAWENKALLIANEPGKDKFEIVTPSESVLTEPAVSVVNKVVEKKGTKEVVEAYPKYLYSPEGQEIAARNYYRPRDVEITRKYEDALPKLKLFTIDEEFGSWMKTQKGHFANGGTFDQIGKRWFPQDNC